MLFFILFMLKSPECLQQQTSCLQVRWWLRGENIYVAHNIDVGKEIRYVLGNLKQQVMYEVRVFGYSRGGDGLQSSPTLEFVLGEILFIYLCK